MKVPASVSVITAQEIQERNITHVKEILGTLPGVFMDPMLDRSGGIQMRGMSDDNILVLYDGLPLNLAYTGNTDYESIPVEQIERVEVVRGAASSLYGGRAVAGVINIITKKINGKKFDGNVIISGGSNDTWKKAIDVRGKVNDKWSFAVGYENRETDGINSYKTSTYKINKPKENDYKENGAWVEDGKNEYKKALKKFTAQETEARENEKVNVSQSKNDSEKYMTGGRGEKYRASENFNAAVQYNFDEDKSLKYTYRHSKYEYRYHDPYSYVKGVDSGKEYFNGCFYTTDGSLIGIKYKNYFGYVGNRETDYHIFNYNDTKNLWMVNFGIQDDENAGSSSVSETPKDLSDNYEGSYGYFPSKNYNLDLQKTWEDIGKHTITVGANWKDEQVVTGGVGLKRFKDLHSFTGKRDDEIRGKAESFAVFVQDEYKISEPLTLYLGGRYDHYKKYDGWNKLDGDLPSESYNEFSPKVSLEYTPTDDLTYFITYGHSFNSPRLNEVYASNDYKVANPNLKPETSDTFEIGVKKKINDTLLGVSLYQINTEDLIDYGDSPVEGKNWSFNNGEAERKGIEFELKHKFNDKLSTYLNYAWQKGKIKSDNSDIYDIPKHLFHAGFDYNVGKFNAVVDAQYVSERNEEDVDSGEYGTYDAFFVMNTYFNYKLTPQATLQFGIYNIFDKEYYSHDAAQGRTYNVSLRYSF